MDPGLAHGPVAAGVVASPGAGLSWGLPGCPHGPWLDPESQGVHSPGFFPFYYFSPFYTSSLCEVSYQHEHATLVQSKIHTLPSTGSPPRL